MNKFWSFFFFLKYHYNGDIMYKKMKLNYPYNALEPYISEKTLRIHYDILYDRYLNNLNKLLLKNNFNFNIPKEEVYNIIKRFPIEDREGILFNLGGVINHEMYFSELTSSGDQNREFENIINSKYLSFANFIDKYIAKAKELRGSGYTFLVLDKDKELALVNLPNQDNPYQIGLIPIMNLDIWEHAYFLDYEANKDEYFKNFFKLVDFSIINERYKESINKIC